MRVFSILVSSVALGACSASTAPSDSESDLASCTEIGGVLVASDTAGSVVRYTPNRFIIKAIRYGVMPPGAYDYNGCPSNATGTSPFCSLRSAVRYRMEPAALTTEQTQAIFRRLGRSATLVPNMQDIDPSKSTVRFTRFPEGAVPGGMLDGDPASVEVQGESLVVTGWVGTKRDFGNLNKWVVINKSHLAFERVALGGRTACASGMESAIELDWSQAESLPTAANTFASGNLLDAVAGIKAMIGGSGERQSLRQLITDEWSSEGRGFVAPTIESHTALSSATFPELQRVLDGTGTPALSSAAIVGVADKVDGALETFLRSTLLPMDPLRPLRRFFSTCWCRLSQAQGPGPDSLYLIPQPKRVCQRAAMSTRRSRFTVFNVFARRRINCGEMMLVNTSRMVLLSPRVIASPRS
jgi:hypothetical protein